ncbi:MAG: LCP family protein [Candidatus Magasanikbacteria bacterium]|nr:LCP family protein [Candidatus Magasanikbacteria bacterium]
METQLPPSHINFLHRKTLYPEQKPRQKKWLFLSILILIIVLSISGYASANKHKNFDPIDYDPVTLEPKKPEGLFKKISYLVFKKETKLEGHKDDRINMLLLGIGGPGHEGPYLSDTIMLASIRPSHNDIALISIPRDMAIEIPGYGVQKINHANAYGEKEKENWGAAFATEVIKKEFKIDIPYYIRLDFKAFEEIIDEVGGVRIDVDRAFTDYMYPAPNELYQTLIFKQGPQTMNGDTALKFVRSRHGNNSEGSDFARAARQQKVILALKEKLLSFSTLSNPLRIKNVMDSLERHMTTNMEFDEILSFTKIARGLNTNEIRTLVLDTSVGGYLINTTGADNAWLLSPRTGNYEEISSAIQNIFENTEISTPHIDTTPIQEKPSYKDVTIEIQNGTWNAGLAARLKQRLIDEEFYVEDIGNVDPEIKPIDQSGIYVVSSKNSTKVLQTLADKLHISIRKDEPVPLIKTATTTDILIVVGNDFVE